jgi:heme/copper-type cytochrome/quinol oxidase subunit 2
MLPRLLLLLLFCIDVVSAGAHRLQRFLNTGVHNGIDVLSKSQEDHHEQTSVLRNIIFGSTITLSIMLLLIVFGLLVLFIRFRRHSHRSICSSISTRTNPSPHVTVDPMALHNLLETMTDTRHCQHPPQLPMLQV